MTILGIALRVISQRFRVLMASYAKCVKPYSGKKPNFNSKMFSFNLKALKRAANDKWSKSFFDLVWPGFLIYYLLATFAPGVARDFYYLRKHQSFPTPGMLLDI